MPETSDACVGDECNCAMVGGERACMTDRGLWSAVSLAGVERIADFEARPTGHERPTPRALGRASPSVRARLAEHWHGRGCSSTRHRRIRAFLSGAPCARGTRRARRGCDARHGRRDTSRGALLCARERVPRLTRRPWSPRRRRLPEHDDARVGPRDGAARGLPW